MKQNDVCQFSSDQQSPSFPNLRLILFIFFALASCKHNTTLDKSILEDYTAFHNALAEEKFLLATSRISSERLVSRTDPASWCKAYISEFGTSKYAPSNIYSTIIAENTAILHIKTNASGGERVEFKKENGIWKYYKTIGIWTLNE